MLSKKRIKGLLKKGMTTFAALAIALSTVAMPVGMFAPTTVKAAVTTSGIIDGPPGMMIGPGMLLPALTINVAANAGESLVSVAVDILVPGGSIFDPTTDLAPLSASVSMAGVTLYKDNKSAGGFGYPDPPGDFQDIYLPLASTPTWSQSGSTYSTTLTLASPSAVPADDSGNNAGGDYFVMISTSSSPPPGGTFQVQIPISGITVNSTTFPGSATPASPNVITVGSGGMMGDPVIISEIQTAGGGGSAASDEFIELYNRSPDPVNISAWSLQYKDGTAAALSGGSPASKIDLTGTIPGNGYFLVANSDGYDYGGTKAADVTYTASNFALSATGGTVFWVNNQTALTNAYDSSVTDTVAWGTGTLTPEGMAAPAPASNGSIERKAFPEATVASMTSGIDSTMGNSSDSDYNFNDFVVRTTSDPQNTGDTESADNSGTNPVVINEVFYNNPSAGHQWIELYNNDAGPVDISGYKIIAAGKTYVVPGSTNIGPGVYMVVHWNFAGSNDAGNLYTGTASWAAMSNLAGDVYLTDSGDSAEDYVEYGAAGQASEATAGGTQWPAGDFVPGVLQGDSIGRGNNGHDTNKASDWQGFASPTQGAINAGGDSFPPDPVTGVALADNDATDFGLDGVDVTVTWTPATAADTTFDKYDIYLLPAATALDTASHSPFAEVFGSQTVATFTASPAKAKDSAGDPLADGSYKAHVVAVDMAMNKSVAVASSAATLTAETSAQSGSDTSPPMIMGMPVWSAQEGINAIIMAQVFDDRALDSSTPAQLKWRVNGGGSYNAVTGVEAASGTGLYRFVLPWNGAWNTSTMIDYYLMALDAAGNYTYFTGSPAFDTAASSHDAGDEATAATKYLAMGFTAAASYNRTISGTVYDSTGVAMSGAVVMIPGSGLEVVTTGGPGTYSFTVTDGNYAVVAMKADYMEGWIDGIFVNSTNTTSTDHDFYLASGSFGMGGDAEKAFVRWTDPGDGMMGAPVDINMSAAPLVAHMSEAMDSSTIIDTNASDAGSNVYLTMTGEDRVAGLVTYDESDPNDPKIIFYSTTALSKGTPYFFVITSAVTDLAGNAIEGNQPDGNFVVGFTTFSETSGGTFGTGISFPPFVTGSMPAPGSFSVPTDTKITVSFSEAMDPSTIEATSSTGLNVKLWDPTSGSGAYVTLASVTLDNATKTIATMTMGSALAANHHYEIRVLGGATSSKGIFMSDPGRPGYATEVAYTGEFDTSSGVDASGAPQIAGTGLEMYRQSAGCDISTSGCLIDVPVNMGVIEIGFTKDIDPATVTRTTITLKVGTTTVKGSVDYKSLDRVAVFAPSLALSPNTTYTLKVLGGASGINDIIGGAGHFLAVDYYAVFTTSNQADTGPPMVTFANASDFKVGVSFSEPMNAAKRTNTGLWASSVLNPGNYTLYTDTGPPTIDPSGAVYTGNGVTTGDLSEGGGISINYDGESYTVTIEGLQLSPMGGFRIWATDVTDLSGNVIDGNIAAPSTTAFGRNAAGGPVESSAGGGMMGPGTMGMMGPKGSGMDMGSMGTMPSGVFPMSMLAGSTTTYMIDIPLQKAIPAGGTIVLTFPSGFDISGAKNADPNGDWAHQDINGPGPGIVVLGTASEAPQSGGADSDGVTVNTSARTITITLGAVGTAGYLTTGDATDDFDFLHLEIAGIANSNIPKSFETSGYTVDIKTISSGSLLESVTSMSFFIMPAGQYSISGTITFPNPITTAAGEPFHLFGGSPMVGPIEVEVPFSNSATANYSITGLPEGDYMIMTEPMITVTGGVGNGDYFGSGMPEPIWVDATTTSGNVYTKNFTFTTSAGRPGLTVNLVGDFTGTNAGDIDIFAGSPVGFAVKTVSLSANYTSGSPFTTTLYLPANGTYMVGMGPAMPKGPMMTGPPPMPEWAPPAPIDVSYNGSAWTETSGTANDGIVTFTVGTALAIAGHVLDGAGQPIPNVEVYAYSPMGMFGTHDSSLRDGSFTLHLPEGMYKAGAFLPGMPPSNEIGIDVRVVSSVTKIYVDGVETADVIIRIAKPDRTISGKVTDGTNTITSASVYAYRTDGPGHAEAMTNSSGVYILYVTPGTWNVGAFLPGFGPVPEKTGIVVTTADIANTNFFPEVGTSYVKIQGNVSIGGAVQTFMPIRAVEIASNGTFTGYDNYSSTDGSGNYTIMVKGISSGSKHYRVDIWTPEYGEVAANSGTGVTNTPTPDQPWNVAVANSDVTDVNILLASAALKTLTISFTGGSSGMTAYVDFERIDPSTTQPMGTGRHFDIKDLTGSTTVSLPAGAYMGFAHIPGYGEFTPTETQSSPYYLDLTSDTTATFDLSGLGEATVTGLVSDGEGNPIPDAFVHIGDPQTGMDFGSPADSTGNYTIAIRTGTYMMGAEKPGYISEPTTITVAAGANVQNLTVTKTSLTISGTVYADANTNGSYDSGEELAFAFVHAEKLGGGFAGTPADPDGSYTLYVSPGDWKLFGVAEAYQEKLYSGNPVNVGSSAVTGINILLSDTVTLTAPKAQPFTPASGSTFDDPNSGLKIGIPPMAIGSETSDFQIQGKETSNLPSTPSATPLGGTGQSITIFDASGNPVTTLNDDITIEMTYTKAQLVAAGITTLAEVAKIKIAYWDDSAASYVFIPTTIGYDPASETTWSNLVSVTFKATTSHLTVFSPIVSSDALAPAAPSGLAGTAGNNQVVITWTAPTTNADSSALTDLLGYEIYRSTSASGTYTQLNSTDILTASYTDTTAVNGTAYFYKVTTADTGGNESVKTSASSGITPVAPGVPDDVGAGAPVGGGGAVSVPVATFDTVYRDGVFAEDFTTKSTDGLSKITVVKGTKGLTEDIMPINGLTIAPTSAPQAPPAGTDVVGLVYDFGPSGATFDPPLTLTFSYDSALLPAGIGEKNLAVGFWDSTAGAWVELESTVDIAAGTISASVGHFSAFTILSHVRPAAFVAGSLIITPDEINVGERVSAGVLVTNSGDLTGTYEVTLKIDDEVIATREVTLAGGARQRVTFITTRDAAGSYTASINGLSETFVVVTPAAFTVSALSVTPDEAAIGENIAVSVTVANTGSFPGTYTVTLEVDGVAAASKDVTLAGGASRVVTFTTSREVAGTYDVRVESLTGRFAVNPAAVPAPGSSPAPVVGPLPPSAPAPARSPVPAPATAVFVLSKLRVDPVEARADEPVRVSVEVRNTGAAAGTRRITLAVNGQTEAVKDVSVSAGATRLVSFTLTPKKPGNYSMMVDNLTTTLTVAPSGINVLMIVALMIGVLVLVAGWLFYRSRSRAHYQSLS